MVVIKIYGKNEQIVVKNFVVITDIVKVVLENDVTAVIYISIVVLVDSIDVVKVEHINIINVVVIFVEHIIDVVNDIVVISSNTINLDLISVEHGVVVYVTDRGTVASCACDVRMKIFENQICI